MAQVTEVMAISLPVGGRHLELMGEWHAFALVGRTVWLYRNKYVDYQDKDSDDSS